jgi:hypothetical protein
LFQGRRGDDGHILCLPLAQPLVLPDVDLVADPYALGWWLAKGYFDPDWPADTRHFLHELVRAGYPLAWNHNGPARVLARDARSLGLGSNRKRIPARYLRAAESQRLGLLQGLGDAAAHVDPTRGTVELTLPNRTLLAQTRELVISLGDKAAQVRPAGRRGLWQLRWTPRGQAFRLARKADTLTEAQCSHTAAQAGWQVVRAHPQPEPVPVRGIAVDSPGQTCLVGRSMIPAAAACRPVADGSES